MRLPLIAMIILYAASIGVSLYLWGDIRHFTRRMRHTRLLQWIWGGFSLLMLLLLVTVTILPKRNPGQGILPLMWILYSYILVFSAEVVCVICSLFGRIPCLWSRRRVNSGLWAGLPLGIVLLILGCYGAAKGRYLIHTNRVEICSTKIPPAFDNYRIAQFSDIHVGTWGSDTTFVSAFVDSLNALRPDLIVFTGDIVNRTTSELLPYVKVFSRLHAPDGVISILGNHDYGDYITWESDADREGNFAKMLVIQQQMGWRLLNNERFMLRQSTDSIMIVGVENWGDPPFRTYGDLRKALPESRDSARNLRDGNYKILLSHNPEHWNREVTRISNIDLTLSGHTHAMQMMVQVGNWRWSPSQYRYQQWAGLYGRRSAEGLDQLLYVNVGCGEVGMPMRIGAVPEITLITLKSGSKPASGTPWRET